MLGMFFYKLRRFFVVELCNINFQYSGEKENGGLENINLIIPDGQVLLLCGQSGCGKTTLTRIINGLIPNFYEGELNGTVLIDGKNVSQFPLYETAKYVGSVFQNPRTQFFTVDSTSELAFGCENQGLAENEIIDRVKNTAEQYGVNDLLGKNIFQLSGGEKQKIACASVAVSNPSIMVLDEPSSNLDISATEDLRQMIQQWKKQGKIVIIAEHRLYYLRNLIDRVLYLKDGKIEKDYSSKEALGLTMKQQIENGLRPFNLFDFPISKNTKEVDAYFECSNFHFSYNKQQDALHINSVSLPQGSIIAVIGHNGAGKSTFAHCLCGLEKHFKGVVSIKDKQYNKKHLLSLCYMVNQDVNHQLFTESTEEELLISMLKPDTCISNRILKRLDLLQFKDRHPMSLSGGQKQRVAIATALVSNREIIVFDEPTSGLDLLHMKEVANALIDIRNIGKTSFVITHDYELIVSCCNYILHLEHGEVQEQYELDDRSIIRLKKFFAESRLG
jgi:energy-coupling factor transport system ATP-binding protein